MGFMVDTYTHNHVRVQEKLCVGEFAGNYATPYKPAMATIDLLKAIMERRRWNQGDVADYFNVTQPTVSRWFKGAEPRGDIQMAIREMAQTQDAPTGVQTLNGELLQAILETLLTGVFDDQPFAARVARSVLRAYEVGIETGVDPADPRDVEKITGSERRQLRDEAPQLSVVK